MRAALRVFGSGQFHAVAVPSLAREAGIAQGSIYNYFASKEDVALAALRETSAAFEARMLAGLPAHGSPEEQLLAAGATLMECAAEDPIAATFLFGVRHETYLGGRARDAYGLPAAVAFVLSAGQARGIVRAGPSNELAEIWLAVIAVGALGIAREPVRAVEIAGTITEAALGAVRRSSD